jgi:flagellar hook-basal body complex protein FliE
MSEIDVSRVLAELRATAAQAQGQKANANEGPAFSTMLKQSIEKVNEMQQESKKLAAAYEVGDPNVNLVETMIAIQKSGVAFQSMLQVRNKLLTAYQEIMRMPV